IPIQAPYDRIKAAEHEAVAANKTRLARQCEKHYIRYRLHAHDDQWDKDILIRESRFADLVLLSGELFYSDIDSRQPNAYLHEVLHAAECPVMVIPENFKQCDHVFMAYDGSKDSLFAIKQFGYLFPKFTNLPTEMVYVRDEASDGIPDLERLRHYTKLHFDAMGFSKLHFQASHYFPTWIGEHKNVLLVAGSYGRSAISYLAKRSFAEQVIHEHKLPVFIAHP
ncbi:MAG TPA: hypothetical protein VG605_05030, partial [Puia sp.]|nr:hypothetical protein [Puia sp.]